MPLGHADARGQRGDAAFGHEAFVDQRGGGLREPARDIGKPVPGRQFGAAAQAGAEAVLLGGGGTFVEGAVLALGGAYGAHRPAVHAGRGDAYEEAPVEAAVMRCHGLVAGIGIEVHAGMLPLRQPAHRLDSDISLWHAEVGCGTVPGTGGG
ncbi:hypothetical protein D3C81_1194010 [compost metagenome]